MTKLHELKIIKCLVAGFAATIPMTAVMFTGRRLWEANTHQQLPPQQITKRILSESGLARFRHGRRGNFLSAASHFSYGGMAALPLIFAPRLLSKSTLFTGASYGLLVWAIGYAGYLPPLKLQPPLSRQPSGRNITMIGAHLVWGAATACLLKTLTENQSATEKGT